MPFVSLSIADKGYNKLVIPFLGKLDDGNVFKNIITMLLSILAVLLLLGGLYLTVSGVSDFLNKGGVIGLILGIVISILTSWALFSILKKRTEQMKTIEYDSLLSFLFVNIAPRLILVIGELLFTLILYLGILQIIAALIGSAVFAPLSNYPGLILNLIPGMEIFSNFIPTSISGSYDYFEELIKVGLSGIAGAFIVLIAFYVYKEIYNYILKLATNLISFLPKFAIPLAIRRKNEN